MNDLREYLILLCMCLGGCTSMAWEVDSSTTTSKLDARFKEESAYLWQCGEYDWLAECPEYHRIWRRYWAARRALADVKRSKQNPTDSAR